MKKLIYLLFLISSFAHAQFGPTFYYDTIQHALYIDGIRVVKTGGSESSLSIGENAGNFTPMVIARGGNVNIGRYSGASLIDGAQFYQSSYNTFIGSESGRYATTGRDNTFIGYQAGRDNNSFANVFIGSKVGSKSTNTNSSVFIGYNIANGTNVSTGIENVFVGNSIAQNHSSGTRNVCMGLFPGASITSGSRNTLIGSEAGERIDEQQQNTFVGFWAGLYNKGSNNAYLGAYAGGTTLGNPAGGTGYNSSNNTFLGVQAGVTEDINNSSVTGTNNSTFVGYRSGAGSPTQVNFSTALGAMAKVFSSYSMAFGAVDSNRPNYGFGGEGYGGGRGVMYMKNANINASSAGADGIIVQSKDTSEGASSLAVFFEQSVQVVGTGATHEILITINGEEYYLQLRKKN